MAELYVLVFTDKNGEVSGFPTGGGSSTAPRVKAYESLSSAKRVASSYGCAVAKVSGFEIVKEEPDK